MFYILIQPILELSEILSLQKLLIFLDISHFLRDIVLTAHYKHFTKARQDYVKIHWDFVEMCSDVLHFLELRWLLTC